MRRSSDNLHPSLPRHSVKSTILPRGDAALLPQSIDLRSAATVIYPSRSSCSLAAHYDIRLVPCDATEKGAAAAPSDLLPRFLPLPAAILLRTICGSFSQGTADAAAADDPDSINLVTFDGASGVGRMNETDPLLIRPLPRDDGCRKNFVRQSPRRRRRRSSYC